MLAQEMTRNKLDIPLLIGGATTSKVHTAVKISPHYPKVVYVTDASRAVGVVTKLLGDKASDYLNGIDLERSIPLR